MGKQHGNIAMGLLTGIALAALLLHWLMSDNCSPWSNTAVHGGISILALFLVWMVFTHQARRLAEKNNMQEVVQQSAVESVLMQTHPKFAIHFADTSGDLHQVQALLADAIEKLMDSFTGMQSLIKRQQEAANGLVVSRISQNGGAEDTSLGSIEAAFHGCHC
jgi:hypothetical protein